MPGLGRAIHVFPEHPQDVDGRDKPGHDDDEFASVTDLLNPPPSPI